MLLRPVLASRPLLAATVAAVVALTIAGYGFVLLGGGTKHSGTFALLVPVLLAASVFLVPGGLLAGVAAGLVLGPAMPLDVAAGIPQLPENWLTRLGWFVGLGAFVAVLTGVPRWRKALRDHDLLVDELSGLLTPEAIRLVAAPAPAGHAVAVDFGMYERLLETHGRPVANAFLRAVAGHLRSAVRYGAAPQPTPLTRVQSDVFGMLLPADPGAVTRTVDAVLAGMPRWVTIDVAVQDETASEPLVVPVTAHLGVARLAPTDLEGFDTFRKSIRAARLARERRRPLAHYDGDSVPVARENVQIAAELLQAIDRGELFLLFQPKLRIADGCIAAAEALLRWQSPRRGLVSPAHFIPIAEQSALIHALSGWVLERAGETAQCWRERGQGLRLSVNLSGRDLLDDEVVERLRLLPGRVGIEPQAFSLEVTETAFIGDLEPIAARLVGLRDIGFDILVDDFGTGCSSFAYLHRLPVDGVKIDRAFVSAIQTDATASALVGSMIDWCRRIGKRTIAEGVEDAAVAEILAGMGCDEIQGYWVSRPLPSPDLLDWLARRRIGDAGA